MIWELIAYNTDCRYPDDIRYREYTKSKNRAEAFGRIPKIQFTDSGHGVVFDARELEGKRKPLRSALSAYVHEHIHVDLGKGTGIKKLHVHVYKVVGKREYDIEARSKRHAKAEALRLAGRESMASDWGKSDCKMIALDVN